MAGENDRDVLGKADALLRRHSVQPPGSGTESGGVPVLTDFVDDRGAANELAHEVFKRVMLQVEGRLAHDLEKRLAAHLAPQVHAAVISALGDLRQELANAIGDAVQEAVAARKQKQQKT
jgi:hypothetical protein